MIELALPYFHPPPKNIKIKGGNFTCVTEPFDDPGFEERKEIHYIPNYRDDWGFYGYEYASQYSTDKPLRCALLTVIDDMFPRNYYRFLIDLCSGHWQYVLWKTERFAHGRRPEEEWIKIPRYRLNKPFISNFEKAINLLHKNKRFRIAVHRWGSSYSRKEMLDSVLDCCSSFEAIFSMGDELRLRIALAVFFTLRKKRGQGFLCTYEMYGLRSSYIHGARIPEISKENRKKYIDVVSQILKQCVFKQNIPNSEEINERIIKHFSN